MLTITQAKQASGLKVASNHMEPSHLPIWVNVDMHGDMGKVGYELWQGRL